jgi:uncharacterized C2H2 Zn-finger protein
VRVADLEDYGCEYCADDQNRWYGHVRQIGTHADDSLRLLQCPRCHALYEMDGQGARTVRLAVAEARQRYPRVKVDDV